MDIITKIKQKFLPNPPTRVISVLPERRVVVTSIMAIILLLGLPLWWTTTRVYRAQLPTITNQNTLQVPLYFYSDTIQQQTVDRIITGRKRHSRQQIQYLPYIKPSADAPDMPGHYTVQITKDTTTRFHLNRTITASQSNAAKVIADMALEEERRVGDQLQKHCKYSAGYSITLSLLNEDSSAGRFVDWEIEKATQQYLQPFVDALRPLTHLSVSTQVLANAGSPPVTPLRHKNGTYLTPQMLSLFANSPWWNLASTDPILPLLNFVLYVPSSRSQPLYIQSSETNAFVVSQWGGVSIANTQQKLTTSELQHHMGVFITQLRQLVGIPQMDSSNIQRDMDTRRGVSCWELDQLQRLWLVVSRQTAYRTLRSLVRMVDKLTDMVVMDEIQEKVQRALDSLESVERELEGGNQQKAFKWATKASELAETAFFDPSMVSMLYFPDQHKYAIYLPFFLPVAIPLLAAIKQSIRRKEKQE